MIMEHLQFPSEPVLVVPLFFFLGTHFLSYLAVRIQKAFQMKVKKVLTTNFASHRDMFQPVLLIPSMVPSLLEQRFVFILVRFCQISDIKFMTSWLPFVVKCFTRSSPVWLHSSCSNLRKSKRKTYQLLLPKNSPTFIWMKTSHKRKKFLPIHAEIILWVNLIWITQQYIFNFTI